MSKIYFVIGVNGIGKSTLIPHLQDILGADFIIHDFDERGVPDSADAVWRMSETLHWVSIGKGNLERAISTVICGFSKPHEIKAASEQSGVDVAVCLLDANAEVISTRILSRYNTPESLTELERTTGKTPEKFVADNVWVSGKFRNECKESGYYILDTSMLTPELVAEAVQKWVTTP